MKQEFIVEHTEMIPDGFEEVECGVYYLYEWFDAPNCGEK